MSARSGHNDTAWTCSQCGRTWISATGWSPRTSCNPGCGHKRQDEYRYKGGRYPQRWPGHLPGGKAPSSS